MTIWSQQSNFTKGELDPTLLGRVDLDTYYQGVQEATNVLSIPQGGMKKRPGTRYIGDALGNGRLEAFSFSTEQNYLLCFTVGKMQVYKDGVLQTTIDTLYDTIEKVREFDYIQSADTIIITHEDVAPQIIQRTSDVAWTVGDLSLINIPQYDFDDSLSPVPTDEIQVIKLTGADKGNKLTLALEGVQTEEFSYEGANNNMAEAIQEQLLLLPNTGNSGIAVSFDGGSTLNADFEVVFSGASANNWRPITGTFGISGTGDEKVNTSTTQNGTSRKEDVWSATRGWPRTCTFHEGRLWFGGSKSRPSTMWGSNVNDVFNFDDGRARDDQGIDVTLATDQVNAINGLISNRSLQVFTSGAEFYLPASPITPENVSVKPQTNLGSKRVRPVVIEGLTMFVQRTGRAMYQFQYVDEFQSNESRSVSLAAPHLINDPTQLAVSQGSSESDANYIYLVSDTGDLTVFNTQSYEGVQSFTRWTGQGAIVSVAVVDNTLYLLSERNGTYSIAVADSSLNTDSAVVQSVTGPTVSGLDNLEGETVKVKAEGAVQLDKVVSGGTITLDRDVDGLVEVGLEYQPVIKTMPFNINLNDGSHAAQKKRILRCAIRVDKSNGVIVNGQRLADKTIGQDQFSAPIPQTEFKRVFLAGWSLEASVTITQDTPYPLTVLALDLEVKV